MTAFRWAVANFIIASFNFSMFVLYEPYWYSWLILACGVVGFVTAGVCLAWSREGK